MKILFLSTQLFPDVYRGGGVYAKNVYDSMKRSEKFTVSLISLRHSKDLDNENYSQVTPKWEIRNIFTFYLALPYYILKAIIRTIRMEPDIIHCNAVVETVVPMILRRDFTFTLHDLAPFRIGKISKPIIYLALRDSKAVFVTTKWMEKQIKEVCDKPLFKIPNAVRVSEYGNETDLERKVLDNFPELEYKDVVLFVGALEKHKGVENLLKATQEIRKGKKDIITVLVGDSKNAEENILESLDKLRKENACIHFEGISDEKVKALYCLADIFILPSKELEGQGIVLLEAMASGNPIVASNLPVFRETVGDAGIFINPGSFQEISESIERIIEDEDVRARLAENSKERAKRFDFSEFRQRVEKVLSNIYKEIHD